MADPTPRRGDFVAIDVSPQTGHEQPGRRPALVISHDDFNRVTGFCMVCPVTRTDRGYPFHVPIPVGVGVEGAVMVDQLRSLDHRARSAVRIGRAPLPVFDEVLAVLDACLF